MTVTTVSKTAFDMERVLLLMIFALAAFAIPMRVNYSDLLEGVRIEDLKLYSPTTAAKLLKLLSRANEEQFVPDVTGLDSKWGRAKYLSNFLMKQYLNGKINPSELSLEDIQVINHFLKNSVEALQPPEMACDEEPCDSSGELVKFPHALPDSTNLNPHGVPVEKSRNALSRVPVTNPRTASIGVPLEEDDGYTRIVPNLNHYRVQNTDPNFNLFTNSHRGRSIIIPPKGDIFESIIRTADNDLVPPGSSTTIPHSRADNTKVLLEVLDKIKAAAMKTEKESGEKFKLETKRAEEEEEEKERVKQVKLLEEALARMRKSMRRQQPEYDEEEIETRLDSSASNMEVYRESEFERQQNSTEMKQIEKIKEEKEEEKQRQKELEELHRGGHNQEGKTIKDEKQSMNQETEQNEREQRQKEEEKKKQKELEQTHKEQKQIEKEQERRDGEIAENQVKEEKNEDREIMTRMYDDGLSRARYHVIQLREQIHDNLEELKQILDQFNQAVPEEYQAYEELIFPKLTVLKNQYSQLQKLHQTPFSHQIPEDLSVLAAQYNQIHQRQEENRQALEHEISKNVDVLKSKYDVNRRARMFDDQVLRSEFLNDLQSIGYHNFHNPHLHQPYYQQQPSNTPYQYSQNHLKPNVAALLKAKPIQLPNTIAPLQETDLQNKFLTLKPLMIGRGFGLDHTGPFILIYLPLHDLNHNDPQNSYRFRQLYRPS